MSPGLIKACECYKSPDDNSKGQPGSITFYSLGLNNKDSLHITGHFINWLIKSSKGHNELCLNDICEIKMNFRENKKGNFNFTLLQFSGCPEASWRGLHHK